MFGASVLEPDNQTNNTLECDQPPPTKVQCVRPEPDTGKETDQSIDQLSNKVSQLVNQINDLTVTLQKDKAPLQAIPSHHGMHSTNDLGQDEKYILIRHARGVDAVLKWMGMDNWLLVNAGLQCIPCSKVFFYDYIADGREFQEDKNIPKSFVNFKTSILRHIQSGNHLQNCSALNQLRSEEKHARQKAEKCALTCASAAYTTLFFAESRLSYEYHITDIFAAGGVTGSKNHSKRFPGLLLPHLYDVIRSDVREYIVQNELPFGIMADKMTSGHLTRHMMGIRIPVWDLRCSYLSKDIYLQSNPIKDVTGLGVTTHIVGMLEAVGLDKAYQRQHISGGAMDGQYMHLDVSQHLTDTFLKDFHLTWDPAHRIELSVKDANPNQGQSFIDVTSDKIQTVMKLLSYGKNYMEFLTQSKISDHFLTPKIFKSMKFVAHCLSVLNTFDVNYQTIIRTLGQLNTEESIGLQESLLSVSFVFDFLIMKDIMGHFSSSSKFVQSG